MDRKQIGKKIEYLRTKQRMTQYQLALDAGISATYVRELEKGEKCPTVETLDNVCFALHVTLVEFLTEDNIQPPKSRLEQLTDKQRKLLNDFLESL